MSYSAKPRKKPVQRRGEARVDAIVAAARSLAGEMSAEEITTNRIAQRAGVNIGSLYHFFSSKYEIFVAVLSAVYAEFEEALRDALRERPASAREWIRIVVDVHVDYWRPNVTSILLWRRYRFRPELHAIDDEYFSRIGTILSEGLAHYMPRISPERRSVIAIVLAYLCGELVDELAQLEDQAQVMAWVRETHEIALGYVERLERVGA